jgi:hypothetical protein
MARGCVLWLTIAVGVVPCSAYGQTTTAPSTAPSTQSTYDDSANVVAYLADLYGKLVASDSWIGRSLGLISLARLPGEAVTERILKSVKSDPVPAVRVVAWQCVLARAEHLTSKQYRQWHEATSAIAKRGGFRGETRVGLVRMMSIGMPTRSAKRMWVEIFEQTSSLQNQDMPVLDALGECLAVWRSPDLMQYLLERLLVMDDACRAEYVLHRAGCKAAWAGEKSDLGHARMWNIALQQYAAWWRDHKKEWVEILYVPDEPWRDLKPQFVPSVDWEERINRYDKKWTREMELAPPTVRGFDIVFVVDATGSMRWVLDYLKGDVGRILGAARLVSPTARIGLTFYRDHGDSFVTRSIRLTGNLTELQSSLNNMDAHGGGDEPEAVYEALADALSNNSWKWEKDTRRAVVLIGDAPPKPQTQQACEQVAGMCAEKGVSLYIVKACDHDVPAFNALAQAAKQEALAISDGARSDWPYPRPARDANAWSTRLAKAGGPQSPDRQIITGLLTDAISANFRDRVEPLVGIILALTSDHVPEKRAVFGIAPEPTNDGPPVDPQAR